MIGALAVLGETLLHFLWQGTLIGAGLALTLRALREWDPSLRHAAGMAAIAVLLTLPLVTLAFALAPEPVRSALAAPLPAVPVSAARDAGGISFLGGLGACVLAIVLIRMGWLGVHLGRLRRLGGDGVDARTTDLGRRTARIASRFGIAAPPVVLTDDVDAPVVVGVVRPRVLLPPDLDHTLSRPEVDAMLAHELAHLARRDPWANLAQVACDTLLGLHPVVRWVSRRVREEREYCCDDLAARTVGDARTTARALAALAVGHGDRRIALAWQGGSLLKRVERLRSGGSARTGRGAWISAVAGVLALGAAAAVGVGCFHASEVTEPVASDVAAPAAPGDASNEFAFRSQEGNLPFGHVGELHAVDGDVSLPEGKDVSLSEGKLVKVRETFGEPENVFLHRLESDENERSFGATQSLDLHRVDGADGASASFGITVEKVEP